MVFTILSFMILVSVYSVLKDILVELKRERVSVVSMSDDGLQIVKEFRNQIGENIMVEFITRQQWGAEDAKVYNRNIGKVNDIYFHHTVIPPTNNSHADSRKVQAVAFGRGYSDVSYTLGIHPNGEVAELRVYNGRPAVGAHTLGHNSTAIAIVYYGDYTGMELTQAQLDVTPQVISKTIALGWVSSKPRLFGHKQVYATACPSENVMKHLGHFAAGVNGSAQPAPPAPPAESRDYVMRGDSGNPARHVQLRLNIYGASQSKAKNNRHQQSHHPKV